MDEDDFIIFLKYGFVVILLIIFYIVALFMFGQQIAEWLLSF